MIRINLLPFRAARKKENIRRQVSVFFLCLLLVMIVFVWVHFYLGNKQTRLTTSVSDTKKELALYKKKNDEINTIRKKLKDLEMRQNVIEDLEKQRFEPVHIMEELTDKIVPERMWLTRLNIGGSQMDIDGIALDNKTVADFIDNLEEISKLNERSSHMYEKVRLNKLQQEEIRSLNMKKFEITALKMVKTPEKPNDKKNKRK
ncbi:MAG: pilus assembly protein PilN [Desulfobacteraceae bacterium]|nr:pilus assembly protein PilN [Desulfobacteraceae bacterium]MBC2750731.1 PilN domain-containing protein [Desulfobacteraceae bacterium]